MKLTLSQTFIFEAAHTLDRSESSRRIHGHTYHCEIGIDGSPDKRGMICDLSGLQGAAQMMKALLDHRFLDEVPQLGAPTLENLCLYISRLMPRYPCMVRIWRADGGACTLKADAPPSHFERKAEPASAACNSNEGTAA